MGTYIVEADITDDVVNDFGSTIVDAKVDLSDDAVEDLANRKGVEAGSIETDPVHWILKRWAIAWVCKEICFDYLGKNNIEVAEDEKYKIKYDLWNERLKEFEALITPSVLTGTATERRDRATVMSGVLFRS